jgi:imidazolonepropionase-like amidohydrolase
MDLRMRGLAVALAAVAAVAPASARGESLALVGGRLIDGYGGAPLEDSVLVIEGERIAAVGRLGEVPIPAGAEVISTEGMSVLPGLWDMHVHLMIVGHSDYDHWDRTYPDRWEHEIMPAAAAQLLRAGVTSARDLGAPLETILAVRERIAKGEVAGPTLYVSGPFLQHRPYPGTEAFRWGVDGPEDARAKVDRLADAGVDFVKLIDQDQMTMEEVQAIVDRAHQRGLPVLAHAHRVEEIRRGLAAGVDGFEHTGLGTAPAYPEEVMAGIRERANTLYWTPTVSPLLLYEYTRDNPERIDDPRWKAGLPDDVVEDVGSSLEHLERLDYYQLMPKRRPTIDRKFAQLRESGVVMLVGTDSGVPLNFHSDATWRELDVWVNELGVPAIEAIRAATYWPAVAQGVADRVGTVAEGKVADVIAVRGDVLRHVALLQDVDVVIARGKRVR